MSPVWGPSGLLHWALSLPASSLCRRPWRWPGPHVPLFMWTCPAETKNLRPGSQGTESDCPTLVTCPPSWPGVRWPGADVGASPLGGRGKAGGGPCTLSKDPGRPRPGGTSNVELGVRVFGTGLGTRDPEKNGRGASVWRTGRVRGAGGCPPQAGVSSPAAASHRCRRAACLCSVS